jgi:hypothetical protein
MMPFNTGLVLSPSSSSRWKVHDCENPVANVVLVMRAISYLKAKFACNIAYFWRGSLMPWRLRWQQRRSYRGEAAATSPASSHFGDREGNGCGGVQLRCMRLFIGQKPAFPRHSPQLESQLMQKPHASSPWACRPGKTTRHRGRDLPLGGLPSCQRTKYVRYARNCHGSCMQCSAAVLVDQHLVLFFFFFPEVERLAAW